MLAAFWRAPVVRGVLGEKLAALCRDAATGGGEAVGGQGADQVWHTPVSSPAGRKRIAQRFNAGLGSAAMEPVPSGTTETLLSHDLLSSLAGLEHAGAIVPALKRWAILGRPAGLETALQGVEMRPFSHLPVSASRRRGEEIRAAGRIRPR